MGICGNCQSEFDPDTSRVLMFGELICPVCKEWTGLFEDEFE